jgi:hypothetical protein
LSIMQASFSKKYTERDVLETLLALFLL